MQGTKGYFGLLIGQQLSHGFSARHITTYAADVFPFPSLLNCFVVKVKNHLKCRQKWLCELDFSPPQFWHFHPYFFK